MKYSLRPALRMLGWIALVIGIIPSILGLLLLLVASIPMGDAARMPGVSREEISGLLVKFGPFYITTLVAWIMIRSADRLPAPPPSEASGPAPWDAVVRSLFFPGAGQIYNGQVLKGILLFPFAGLFYLLNFFFVISFADVDRRSPVEFGALLPYYLGLGIFWIYGIIDAYWVAVRRIRASTIPE